MSSHKTPDKLDKILRSRLCVAFHDKAVRGYPAREDAPPDFWICGAEATTKRKAGYLAFPLCDDCARAFDSAKGAS